MLHLRAAWDAARCRVICTPRCPLLLRTTSLLPPPLRCAALCLLLKRRLCAAHHPLRGPAAVCIRHIPVHARLPGSFQDHRKRRFAEVVNVRHSQSVLLRVYKRLRSPASVTTAHRVCGKWPWPLLWPANQPFGAELPGCERRITVSGLVSR